MTASSEPRPTTLRTRLVVAIVGVVVATLGVAGVLGAVGISRASERAATDGLRSQAALMQREARRVIERADRGAQTPGARGVRLRDALDALRSATQVVDARLVFVREGVVVDPATVAATRLGRVLGGDDAATLFALPSPGIERRLDIAGLAPGTTTTARHGNTVELATALGRVPGARTQAVLVATRAVDTGAARRAVRALGFAAAVALALGIAVAVLLARRLTASLRAIDATASAIASGDLQARVRLPGRADRELVDVAGTINVMADDLDAARGAQRAFLQAVGHDLRTPVTAIRGWAEALADGTVDDDDPVARRHAADVITTEAARLERLVGDLLDLARLDADEFSLHPSPVDAGAVVQRAVNAFVPLAERRGLTLSVDVATAPSVIDGERLAQLVANLLDNAVQHARRHVAVSARADGSRFRVEVHDDGPGIPLDVVEHVFDRHWTMRRSPDASRGNGLGLTIVRQLARAMGGDAAVATTSADGTTLAVWIETNAPR